MLSKGVGVLLTFINLISLRQISQTLSRLLPNLIASLEQDYYKVTAPQTWVIRENGLFVVSFVKCKKIPWESIEKQKHITGCQDCTAISMFLSCLRDLCNSFITILIWYINWLLANGSSKLILLSFGKVLQSLTYQENQIFQLCFAPGLSLLLN